MFENPSYRRDKKMSKGRQQLEGLGIPPSGLSPSDNLVHTENYKLPFHIVSMTALRGNKRWETT